ncbi:MAG: ABC transporter substrate-binding protein [Chloroflexi bacterium]|nr:ABC transporter substrate-binding protein [Chloroflexota bacterium]
MRLGHNWMTGFIATLVYLVVLASCAAPAQPSPTPTKSPAAQPTRPAEKEAAKALGTPAEKPAEKTGSKAPVKAAMPGPLSPAVKVRVGDLATTSDAPTYVALEKGFFKEQGIDLELTSFDQSAQVIPALSSGQLEVAGAGITVALYNAVARGIGVRAVADRARNSSGHEFNTLAVRKDLADRVKDFKDLKGLKVALVSKNGPGYVQIAKAVAKGGLSLADIDIVTMPFPDMMSAFANKAIDAAIASEPLATQGAERGLFVNWKTVHPDFYPNHQVGVLMYGPQFIERQPEAAKRFMVAYIKGIRAYLDGFDKNVGLDEIIKILTAYTPLKDASVYRKVRGPGFDRNGYIFTQHLIDDQDFFVSQGIMKPEERADMKKLIDDSYVEYALSILGKE